MEIQKARPDPLGKGDMCTVAQETAPIVRSYLPSTKPEVGRIQALPLASVAGLELDPANQSFGSLRIDERAS